MAHRWFSVFLLFLELVFVVEAKIRVVGGGLGSSFPFIFRFLPVGVSYIFVRVFEGLGQISARDGRAAIVDRISNRWLGLPALLPLGGTIGRIARFSAHS